MRWIVLLWMCVLMRERERRVDNVMKIQDDVRLREKVISFRSHPLVF